MISVTTANICGNPIRARWAVKMRMRQALGLGGVTFGQEVAGSNHFRIGRGNYSTAWHNIAGSLHRKTFGGTHEVPISITANYAVEAHYVVRVHGGKRGVSPARFITVVKAINNGYKVAFVNCHPVSKPRRGVPFSKWRIARWNEYHDALATSVELLVNDGYTVVYGGDMNKRLSGIPKVHPTQRLLASSGLDHLWLAHPEAIHLDGLRTSKIARTALMDHPILHVTFGLRRT